MGPLFRKKKVQNSICKQTLPLPNSNLSSTDWKSGSSRRGQQTPTQRGSGEDRTGRSRLLFSYFPGSQEEREITTNNRSVQTEYVSGYSVVQNGDTNKVRQVIQHNGWAFSLDLTDAYLHVEGGGQGGRHSPLPFPLTPTPPLPSPFSPTSLPPFPPLPPPPYPQQIIPSPKSEYLISPTL